MFILSIYRNSAVICSFGLEQFLSKLPRMEKPANHQSRNFVQESGNLDQSSKSGGSEQSIVHEPEAPSAVAHSSKEPPSGEDLYPSVATEVIDQPTREQERVEL